MKGLALKLRGRIIAYLCVASLLLLLMPVRAAAQGQTVLAVTPAEAEVPVAGQFSLDLTLTDAVNVNAFDIMLTYDGNLLRLDGWTNGNFLSNLAVVVNTNNPGNFRLVCTQMAMEGVSGDGSLLHLNFTALAAGQTEITLAKGELSEPQGVAIHPALVDGQVTVGTAQATPTQALPTAVLPTAVLPTQTPLPATPITYPLQTTQPAFATPQATLPPAPTANPDFPPVPYEDQPLLTITLPATLPAGQEPTANPELLLTETQVLAGTQPLRNNDPTARWQPSAGDLLPWVLLGVELAALIGLLALLMRRRP